MEMDSILNQINQESLACNEIQWPNAIHAIFMESRGNDLFLGLRAQDRDRVKGITKHNLKMKVIGAAAKEVERTVILKSTTAVFRRWGRETFYQNPIVVRKEELGPREENAHANLPKRYSKHGKTIS